MPTELTVSEQRNKEKCRTDKTGTRCPPIILIPDPEIFLLAASKIHVDPKKCLVIEDGISGMKAAKSANMKCIGLVSDKNKNYPTKNLVTSLAEITPEYLNQIV